MRCRVDGLRESWGRGAGRSRCWCWLDLPQGPMQRGTNDDAGHLIGRVTCNAVRLLVWLEVHLVVPLRRPTRQGEWPLKGDTVS
jgi:hypothetical protein